MLATNTYFEIRAILNDLINRNFERTNARNAGCTLVNWEPRLRCSQLFETDDENRNYVSDIV